MPDIPLPVARPSENWAVLRVAPAVAALSATWRGIARATMVRVREGEQSVIVTSPPDELCDTIDEVLREAGRGHLPAEPGAIEAALAPAWSALEGAAQSAGLEASALDAAREAFAALTRDVFGAALLGEVTPKVRARVVARVARAANLVAAAMLAHFLNGRAQVVSPEAARYLEAARSRRDDANRYLEASTERVHRPRDEAASVLVLEGGVAGDEHGEPVLLGPGGVDVSAAIIAAELGAPTLELWNAGPGFFTADPELVPSARLLRHVGYEEALELASLDPGVLHPRGIEILRRAGVGVIVRNATYPDVEGTRLSSQAPDPSGGILSLGVQRDVILVRMHAAGMWQQVGFLADVFEAFRRHGLSVDLVSTAETSVSVTLDPTPAANDHAVLESLVDDLRGLCDATVDRGLAAIAVVGRQLRAVLPQLATAFEVLGGHAVHLITQAASDLNLSAVVDADQADRVVRELHAGFFGAALEDDVFGPPARRLSERVEGIAPVQAWWVRRRSELLALAGEATPHYVYDLETIREAARSLREVSALDRVLYSVKANAHPAILETIRAEGLGFECVSLGEVEHVLATIEDLDPSEVLFTPNFAPRTEYAGALELGVLVTIDNLYILEAWPELFEGRSIFVRLDPGQGRGHHARVRTAGPGSKFGVSPEAIARLAVAASEAGATVIGLHAHLGSGITDPMAWAETAMILAGLAEHFPDARILDLGGGLAAPDPGGARFDVGAAAEHLAGFKATHDQFEIWLEPGRYLVAEAGVLLARVTQRKSKGSTEFVGLDAGMHSLIRPALYGAYHDIVNLSRLEEPIALTAEVVGPICESGDVLGHARRLPETHEGDVMLIATAGAYGRVMASTYNARLLPRESVLP